MKSPTLSIDALNKVVAALPEDNLAASRRAALDQLRQDGMPGSREEDWKYTDLSSAIAISNRWLENGAPLSRDDLQDSIDEITNSIAANWLVIANGVIRSTGDTRSPMVNTIIMNTANVVISFMLNSAILTSLKPSVIFFSDSFPWPFSFLKAVPSLSLKLFSLVFGYEIILSHLPDNHISSFF